MKGGAQTMASAAAALFFGPYKLQPTQIFYESSLSVAITNLKPIVEGHVLVIPKRVCARFRDLTQDEVQDLFFSGHKIQPVLEQYYGCTASNLAIQDGAEGMFELFVFFFSFSLLSRLIYISEICTFLQRVRAFHMYIYIFYLERLGTLREMMMFTII